MRGRLTKSKDHPSRGSQNLDLEKKSPRGLRRVDGDYGWSLRRRFFKVGPHPVIMLEGKKVAI